MSTESEPTQPLEPNAADDENPVNPPVTEDETQPGDTETPPPPPPPPGPITFEPATWYEVTSACTTTSCPNLNTSTTEPMVYSNGGTIRMVCGPCGKDRLILSATKLDPQPEVM